MIIWKYCNWWTWTPTTCEVVDSNWCLPGLLWNVDVVDVCWPVTVVDVPSFCHCCAPVTAKLKLGLESRLDPRPHPVDVFSQGKALLAATLVSPCLSHLFICLHLVFLFTIARSDWIRCNCRLNHRAWLISFFFIFLRKHLGRVYL